MTRLEHPAVEPRQGDLAAPAYIAAAVSKALSFLRADRLSAGDLALVTRQLATLIKVAPLEESLRTIALQVERPTIRRVLLDVHASLLEGYRLSDAMARPKHAFPALYRAMIAGGESSGALPRILDRLADLLEREQQTQSKLLAALIYPIALALTAMVVVIALMTFVVPQVVDQFVSMGQTLPLLTRIIVSISNLLRFWGWLILVIFALGAFAGTRALQNPSLRLKFDAGLLRLPVVGRLIRNLNAARLARTLATMIASGLPVMSGLQLTARTLRNRVLREATMNMAASIREGGSLSAAMRRTGVLPPILIYMAASGENSGRLDTMLESAAEYLDREINTFISVALSLLEPTIIIVMGGVVATIVLSILLPILQINTLALG